MFARIFLTVVLFLSYASTAAAKTYYWESECSKTISIAGPTVARTLHRIVKENGTRITEAYWSKNWFRMKDLEIARELDKSDFMLGDDVNTYRTPAKVNTAEISALARLLLDDVKVKAVRHQPLRGGATFEGVFLKDLTCGITENIMGYEGESECHLTVDVNCGLEQYTEFNK